MGVDVVVVGGGTAGCVVAARLSEDPSRRVLLVEAGPDYPTVESLPADVADASQPTTGHDWGFTSEPGADGRVIELPRARLIGGCGATNAAFFARGWPADYDGWAARGLEGWSFADLLPTFRAVEADPLEDAGEWHGRDGPVPLQRPSPDELPPLQRDFLDAAVTCGHPFVDDHNRPGAIGVGVMPRNVRDGVRMSTALTHLAPARARPNLDVRGDALVDRVERTAIGGAARGVRLASGEVIEADEVVLAAGAYASPAILLRSGIDFPGVGDNLVDHPLVAVDLPTTGGFTGPRFAVILTFRSHGRAADAPPDLQMFAAGPFDADGVPGGGVFGLVTTLVAPRSRGSVRLRSPDPADPPRIDPAHLRDADDRRRMVEATVMARRLARTPALSEWLTGPELAPGPAIGDDDVDGLARSIGSRLGSYHHPVGTCAMGAVVDARGAVHGVDRLHVADASVMPTIPCTGTNLSTIVVAERIAGWLAGNDPSEIGRPERREG